MWGAGGDANLAGTGLEALSGVAAGTAGQAEYDGPGSPTSIPVQQLAAPTVLANPPPTSAAPSDDNFFEAFTGELGCPRTYLQIMSSYKAFHAWYRALALALLVLQQHFLLSCCCCSLTQTCSCLQPQLKLKVPAVQHLAWASGATGFGRSTKGGFANFAVRIVWPKRGTELGFMRAQS